MWKRGVFEAVEDETVAVPRAEPRAKRAPRRWRATAAIASALALTIASLATNRVQIQSVGAAMLRDLMQSETVAPARVFFEIPPGTEIRIDGGGPLAMPVDQPLKLAPGRHRFVFDHPEHGRARHFVELRVGEEQRLRNVFGEGTISP